MASQERLLLAAERLLAKNGGSEFTLLEVCRESGLSVGGLYRRFEDKYALIRAVQQRLNARMAQEFVRFEAEEFNRDRAFEDQVKQFVSGVTDLLKRHAPLIKAMIEASLTDPIVARQGFETYRIHEDRFKALIVSHRASIAHADPQHAAEFCFSCIFELVASYFGFGRRVLVPQRRSWAAFVADLQRLCIAYLTSPAVAKAARQKRPSGKQGRVR